MSELGTKDKSKHLHARMQMTQNKHREPCFEMLALLATRYHEGTAAFYVCNCNSLFCLLRQVNTVMLTVPDDSGWLKMLTLRRLV